jgi:hypothetical protein
MTLIVVPESTTSLRWLWNEALPEVINVLDAGGYTVDQENSVEEAAEGGWLRKFGVGPGCATLTAAANTSDESIVFNLVGEKFGASGLRHRDYDDALWDRLEALAHRLAVTHQVVQTVSDPDEVTGKPGSTGTFLPPRGGESQPGNAAD